jgi:hypothetical protein
MNFNFCKKIRIMNLTKGKNMKKIIIGSSVILLAVLLRLLPHPPNMAPIAAIALIGGVYLDRRFALLIPFAALIISDAIIGFHSTIPFVYGSFLATGLIGMWLQSHKKIVFIAGGTLLSSIIFFIVTNFGVWLTGSGWYYPKTLGGLAECYTLAIPFFRNSLLGDIGYTAVLFGFFELAEYAIRFFEKPQTQKIE